MANLDQGRLLERLFWSGVVLGLLISFGFQLNQIVDGDQTQMIYKGYLGAYQGTWLSVGNAASVVGNVPGYLSAVLVGAPLLVWDSPYSIIIILTILRLIGFLLLDSVVRQALPNSSLPRVIFLLLVWLNPWIQFDSLLYNPAYLLFCSGLHLYTAWNLRCRSSFWMTFAHVASIALAMQLHFSWPLLALMSAYLWWRRLVHISWWAVLAVLLISFVSLLPYLSQLIANPDLAHNSDPEVRDRYIGWGAVHVYPVLKSAIYWLRYGAWAFPAKLVNDAGFSWLSFSPVLVALVKYLWLSVLYLLGAITLIASVLANVMAFRHIRKSWAKRKQTIEQGSQWLLLYAFGAFVAVILSSGLSPLVFNYWHLVLILPAATLPVLIWLVNVVYRGVQANLKPVYVCATILIGINLVAMTDSRKFSWKAHYADQVLQHVQESLPNSTLTQTPKP